MRRRDDDSEYVLLRDRRSGQRLELNWYAEDNPFAGPFAPGEALDHLEVRVRDVPTMVETLRRRGIPPATRNLWVNREAVARLASDPKMREMMDQDIWTSSSGHRIVYIQDPDGNFLCLYDHPDEPWDGPIPDHY